MAYHLDEGDAGETKEVKGVLFTKRGSVWIPEGSDQGFHEVHNSGPHLIGKLGAVEYVLDDTGTIISTGHHNISGVGPFHASTGAKNYALTYHLGAYIPDDSEACESQLRDTRDLPDHVRQALEDRANQED